MYNKIYCHHVTVGDIIPNTQDWIASQKGAKRTYLNSYPVIQLSHFLNQRTAFAPTHSSEVNSIFEIHGFNDNSFYRMSLANKTCWVVGGVGVIGRAITRSLIGSGATVIVNSREDERLSRLASDLGNPERLITVHGSLLPGKSDITIKKALSASSGSLNHVVAHGAVRLFYWKRSKAIDRFLFNLSQILRFY